jgi:hypothetical protein
MIMRMEPLSDDPLLDRVPSAIIYHSLVDGGSKRCGLSTAQNRQLVSSCILVQDRLENIAGAHTIGNR